MTPLVIALIDDPLHDLAYDSEEVSVIVLNGWFVNDSAPFDAALIEDMQHQLDICAELLGGAWIEWASNDSHEEEPDTRSYLHDSQKSLLWDYYKQVDEARNITEVQHA